MRKWGHPQLAVCPRFPWQNQMCVPDKLHLLQTHTHTNTHNPTYNHNNGEFGHLDHADLPGKLNLINVCLIWISSQQHENHECIQTSSSSSIITCHLIKLCIPICSSNNAYPDEQSSHAWAWLPNSTVLLLCSTAVFCVKSRVSNIKRRYQSSTFDHKQHGSPYE